MQHKEIVEELKHYITIQVLDGKDIGLNETTPLLEWGVINSLEIARILSFIQQRFNLDIPHDQLIADHFTSLSALADLMQKLMKEQQVAS